MQPSWQDSPRGDSGGWPPGTAAYPVVGSTAPNPTGRPGRRNLLTTGVIIAVFLMAMAALSVFFSVDLGLQSTLVAATVAAVPVLIVVPVYLWVDRMEAEPVRYLVFAFLWGALCAAVGAILLNTGIHVLLTAAHAAHADEVSSVISAPLVEETLKGAAIVLIAWRRRREFDGVIDGIVYAGMAGAGFAFSENILYLGRAFGEAGASGLTEVFFLRCLMGPFAHPLFTACTGIGIGLAVTVARSALGRVAFGLVGLACAMVLHGIWNLSAALGTYLEVYRLATARSLVLREVLVGAVFAALFWQLLQRFGAAYVSRFGEDASLYGAFALVLGLLGWLYLAALGVVLAVEINVVRTRRLYPRALLTPFTDDVDLTPADQAVYTAAAQAQRLKGFQEIDVTFERPGPAAPSTDHDTAGTDTAGDVSTGNGSARNGEGGEGGITDTDAGRGAGSAEPGPGPQR